MVEKTDPNTNKKTKDYPYEEILLDLKELQIFD